jgi:hypothetical protein
MEDDRERRANPARSVGLPRAGGGLFGAQDTTPLVLLPVVAPHIGWHAPGAAHIALHGEAYSFQAAASRRPASVSCRIEWNCR